MQAVAFPRPNAKPPTVSGHYGRNSVKCKMKCNMNILRRLNKQRMHIFFLLIFFLSCLTAYGQSIYISRIGSKFLPGHVDIVITVDNENVRYEMFEHWYTRSFAEMRQVTITLDNLNKFNEENDTIQLKIFGKYVQLVDKKYNVNKKIKHKKTCTSVEKMRKISYAYKISSQYENIRHYELYTESDLDLPEHEFEKRILENVERIR